MENEIVEDEVLDRKELLSQQFDEIEAPVVEEKQVNRDKSGKFAPAVTAPITEPVVEEPVWKRPPSSWKSEYHADWSTASPRLQEYAWNREEQMRAGIEPMVSKAHYADEMQKVFEPYLDTIRGLGLTPAQAMNGLLQADKNLRHGSPQEKEDYIALLRQQYGMNAVEQQAPQQDVVYELRNQLNAVRGQMQGWEEAKIADKKRVEDAEMATLNNEIEVFASKKEHFQQVIPDMVALLQGGRANDLDDAYEKALRLDSKLSENLWTAPQANIQTKVNLADRAAKSAKAAAVSVKSSTPGVSTMTKAQDRRSLLSEQFDQISERF